MPTSAHFRANPKLVHLLGENGTSSEKALTELNRRGSFLNNRTLHSLRRCVLLVLLAATCLTSRAAVDFYSPDANHLWNRLYAGLFARTSDRAEFDDFNSVDLDFEPKKAPTRPAEFRATTHKRLDEVTEEVATKQASWQQFRPLRDGK